MLKYSKTQKRWTLAFLLGLLLAASTPLPPVWTTFHSPGAFLYMGLTAAWGLTVMSRILQKRIRDLLMCCCFFMTLVFVLRICRYDLFRELDRVSEYALYLYGVCYTMTALLSFLAALYVGRREDRKPGGYVFALWIMETLLCAAMLTNPLHGLFYTFAPGSLEIESHGPVYLLMVCWCGVFALAAVAVLLVKCRNSRSRRYWFLPAAGIAAGAALLVWYFAAGGAPKLGGIKLYNLQEAYCLTVILPFEALFRIGLIPTNSDYGLFFHHSMIRAAILDERGNRVLASREYSPEPGAGGRTQRKPIPGGSVVWTEDVAELLRMREELTALNEELAAENELIEQEKQLREERIAFETRNRLYDSISLALKPQAEAMLELLGAEGEEPADPESFRRRLKRVLVLGAYMKRMGNLMLLGDGKDSLPAEELALSLGESFEYLRLGGVACSLDCREKESIPVPQLLLCYRLFQQLIEANAPELHACQAELLPRPGVLLRLALDPEELRGAEEPELLAALAAQGVEREVCREDDTWYVTLRRTPEGRAET